MTKFAEKNIIPIAIGSRAAKMTRIANSGENCGFDYNVTEETRCFYSLYDFPIDSILKSILSDYCCKTYECNHEEWFPCGDEYKFYCDIDTTSRVCNFLTAYFHFKFPYYNLVFTPGQLPTEDNYWHDNGLIYYRLDFPLNK